MQNGATEIDQLIARIYLVGRDGDISCGVGHACEHKSVLHLLIIQEGLVTLVHLSTVYLAGAARAWPSTATEWQVNSCLFRCVQDVGVSCTYLPIISNQFVINYRFEMLLSTETSVHRKDRYTLWNLGGVSVANKIETNTKGSLK